MSHFLGERITVQTMDTSPTPVNFTWRGMHYDVVEVLREWVDTGFGATPAGSRTWYNRHHRRYFEVRATGGEIFRIYLDYKNRKHPTWWLVSREEPYPDSGDVDT